MTLFQLLQILRARAAIVVASLVLTALAGLIVSLLLPKQYLVSASVLVDRNIDPVAGTISPTAFQPGFMSTQVDIISSSRVADHVIDALQLDKDPGLKKAWINSDDGKGDFRVWLQKLLLSKLDAKPSRDSNILQIGYYGTDPVFITKVANAFAQAYLETDLEMKIEPAKRYSLWFEDQTRQARAKVEAAQKALSNYQQTAGIVVSDDRVDYESNRINDLSAQLTQVQSQLGESQSKRASASAATTAEAMQSASVNRLKAEIAQLEARLTESSGNLGRNHPQTLRMQAELATLRGQLNHEVGQIATSFETSYQIDKQREQQLIAAIAAQKSRILDLNRQRNEFNVLRRDVEAAQREYDAVGQRLAQTRLESRSSQSSVSILSPATEPLHPSKPRVLLNTAAAAVAGLMLGVVFALALEFSNRRIRSVNDLGLALEVPVLASISSARRLSTSSWRSRMMLRHEPAAS